MNEPAGTALEVDEPLTAGDVLRNGGIASVYQPIVDLFDDSTVAVEALARGPVGPLHAPDALFAAASREGLGREIEWACRAAAFEGALAVPLGGLGLFVNVESGMLADVAPPHVNELVTRIRASGISVVLELTERDLLRDPAALLRAVDEARNEGWGIALDDVGQHPNSLALMPLIRPDVVKLDLRLVQASQDTEIARIASAVSAYAEESGAVVLAEGIETEVHRERAISLGATLGQGWLLGRPGLLTSVCPGGKTRTWSLEGTTPAAHLSPFELVGHSLPTRIARKSQLLGMSRHLERQACELTIPPMLFAAFEDVAHFTAATQTRYRGYALTCPLVAALGVGLPSVPARGVRGAALSPDDALAREWTVVVLNPHFSAALIARDLGDDGPDSDRRFEFVLTHDRRHVTAAARSLAHRIISAG